MMAGKSPKDQFKKISICGGCTILGELPPEDPVCDSGIFCYGKTPVFVYEYSVFILTIKCLANILFLFFVLYSTNPKRKSFESNYG